ncbi:glutathione S-transferase family protein [Brevundimonas sp.]|uniref:glutathione S-transferase family protein n=1 Tax=Brevundimonas sp. TaxID=1871086 RepID=UPI0035AE8C55
MGQLVDGVWRRSDQFADDSGRFKRQDSVFRNWVTATGEAGPTGRDGFAGEPGRYLLYVSLACPWAHRTLIMRRLKGLDGMIDLAVVHWLMGEDGWTFAPGPSVTGDPIGGATHLHQVYTAAEAGYTGKVTVPVLWDKRSRTMVSNESADIIRMFNDAFDGAGAAPGDYYPADLRDEIDRINDRVYGAVNNGVYKAGFATTQSAYEEAVRPLFETLDWLETHLTGRTWLVGDRLTEADIRLFTTLARFDAVYVGHFKCNLRRIADYPALSGFVDAMLAVPGVAETINLEHIKRHYYESHRHINPTGVVPVGPVPPLV